MERALPVALAVLMGLILTRSLAQTTGDKKQPMSASTEVTDAHLDQLQKQAEELTFADSTLTNAVQMKLNDESESDGSHCTSKQ